jgi:hypothetical protein
MGTAFLLVVPDPKTPGRGHIVLVTAAHVLTEMVGDSALLVARRKAESGWQPVPVQIRIRSNGNKIWVQHPHADVACLWVSLPEELKVSFPSAAMLITDNDLTHLGIHPGDELNVLGYPLGFGNSGDFPVLRSGKIASYPLVPTNQNPFFLLDFRVFKGNSGGPVYFVQTSREVENSIQLGTTFQYIMGLVSEEVGVTQQFQGLYENRSETYPLGLAKVIPASYISEAIGLLPPPSP